jgi:hypothetical protein
LIRAVILVVVKVVAVPVVVASVAHAVAIGIELVRIVRPLTVVRGVENVVIVVIRVADVAQARAVSVNLSRIADVRTVVKTVCYFVVVIIQLTEIATCSVRGSRSIRTLIKAIVDAVLISVALAATASRAVCLFGQQCRFALIVAVVDSVRVAVQSVALRRARRITSTATSSATSGNRQVGTSPLIAEIRGAIVPIVAVAVVVAVATSSAAVPIVAVTVVVAVVITIFAGTAGVPVQHVGFGGIFIDFKRVAIVTQCDHAVVIQRANGVIASAVVIVITAVAVIASAASVTVRQMHGCRRLRDPEFLRVFPIARGIVAD